MRFGRCCDSREVLGAREERTWGFILAKRGCDLRFIPLERVCDVEKALSVRIREGDQVVVRDSLAMVLGLHGLRVGEVARASRGHLFVTGCSLHVPEFKGSRPRDVPLDRTVVDAVVAWRADACLQWADEDASPLLGTRFGGSVFPTQWRRFCRRVTEEVLGEPVRFHCLRHTFAMRVYSVTKDLLLVQKLLGHKHVRSTEVYARATGQVPGELLVKL